MKVAARPPGAELAPEVITARSRSNFLAGFSCLQPARREAMTAIYAFCRVVDDAVDDAPDPASARSRLEFWREELVLAERGEAQTPVGRALQRAMRTFAIPARHLHDLVAGCEMDLDPALFADEPELDLYCYRVAAAVGLACLPAFGATGEQAERYAVELGHALQRTNVLRDLHADALDGRCYVPQTWLDEFGLRPADLAGDGDAAVYADGGAMARLCARLVDSARERFHAAHRLLAHMPRATRRALVPARIMGAVYESLLRALAARGGEIVGPRVRVPRLRKIALALAVFAGVRS